MDSSEGALNDPALFRRIFREVLREHTVATDTFNGTTDETHFV
jgi:hypothetical protein